MNVHGWKATEYTSGNMTIRFNEWRWTWRCNDCGQTGHEQKPEDAMKMADGHRGKCNAHKKSA